MNQILPFLVLKICKFTLTILIYIFYFLFRYIYKLYTKKINKKQRSYAMIIIFVKFRTYGTRFCLFVISN
jgi:hypothetical protein